MRYVTDTVPYKIPKTDYKVGGLCRFCGLYQLQGFSCQNGRIRHEVDSLSDGNVPFIFFFQTKDVRELRYILRRDNFSHPVCIDTEDSFYKLNRFPGK